MGFLCPQKPLRLIRDGEVGRSGIFISNTYLLHCHHQNDSALRRAASCVSHFNVSLIVWAKSQDSVHKPLFFKEKGEPKRIKLRSFCFPAQRLTARPHRLTTKRHSCLNYGEQGHWTVPINHECNCGRQCSLSELR